LINTI